MNLLPGWLRRGGRLQDMFDRSNQGNERLYRLKMEKRGHIPPSEPIAYLNDELATYFEQLVRDAADSLAQRQQIQTSFQTVIDQLEDKRDNLMSKYPSDRVASKTKEVKELEQEIEREEKRRDARLKQFPANYNLVTGSRQVKTILKDFWDRGRNSNFAQDTVQQWYDEVANRNSVLNDRSKFNPLNWWHRYKLRKKEKLINGFEAIDIEFDSSLEDETIIDTYFR